jgi:hypothetical protein
VQYISWDAEYVVPELDLVLGHHRGQEGETVEEGERARAGEVFCVEWRPSVVQKTSGYPSSFQYLSYPRARSREEMDSRRSKTRTET